MMIQEKFDNWNFHQLDDAKKLDYIRSILAMPILQAWENQDRVDEIVVPDGLAVVTRDALQDMSLPSEFPDPETPPPGYDRARLSEDFKRFCAESISVKSAPVEQFDLDQDVPEYLQFIRIVTVKAKENMFLQSWDNSIGLTASLRQKGCPVAPTMAEKRILFFFLHVLEQLGQAEQNKIMTPANAENLMFELSQ